MKKAKILLVDDRDANLVALESVLDCFDVDLIMASSGKAAVQQALQNEFALILLVKSGDSFASGHLFMDQFRTQRHAGTKYLAVTPIRIDRGECRTKTLAPAAYETVGLTHSGVTVMQE